MSCDESLSPIITYAHIAQYAGFCTGLHFATQQVHALITSAYHMTLHVVHHAFLCYRAISAMQQPCPWSQFCPTFTIMYARTSGVTNN
jgi:hypothetical protein